jgi:predicted RNA-binding protein with EMAP domain
LHAVLNSAQMSKLETFQILKYRFINEQLLDAETNVDLHKKAEGLLEEIEKTIDYFRNASNEQKDTSQ